MQSSFKFNFIALGPKLLASCCCVCPASFLVCRTDGNYDMNKKRFTNVRAPSANTDAATKKYVDDNSPTTTRLTVDSDIDMKDRYRILNLKAPSDADEAATKSYTDNNFLNLDGTKKLLEI